MARRAGRLATWAVVVLLAVVGVRSIISPPVRQEAAPKWGEKAEAEKDDVPETLAQQVAARFARSYLTWTHQAPQIRERELARDLPKGADAKAGWDGQGTQLVAQSIPGTVTQTRPHHARVLVDVRVSTTIGSGRKAGTTSAWMGLEVPVSHSSGRVLVTGQPALVGLEEPVRWKEPDAPATDTELTERTRTTVENFLKAWVNGTADQAAAPGAKVTPLGGHLTLRSLDSWSAFTGSGDRRTGLAQVRWQLGGAVLQQTYRITLAQVSADDASRWQVWRVTAQ
ncbi:conjugal transfer protein [Streptomyces sp. NPDC053474]|uniref:conjugal transfer protein n=1 Tax=Streptomyces sp. NPDC053474 TaxID=3365704 RepID=UPI0037D38873